MKPASPSGRIALASLLLLVTGGLVFQLATTGLGRYPLDDAYIVDHSVAGILAGHESRFLGSSPWQGVTSPFYVAAIAAFALALPIDLAHRLVSALAVLLLAGGFYALGRRAELDPPLAAALALVGLLPGIGYYQLANGLETGLAMAALAWTLVVFDLPRPPLGGAILIGLLPLVRPELAALTLFYPGYLLAKRPEGHRRAIATTLATLAAAALLLWAATGALFANTLAAKTYFFAEGCRPLVVKTFAGLEGARLFLAELGPFALGFLMVAASRLRWLALAFVTLFLLAYVERLPGALQHNFGRYCHLLVPLGVLGWACCLGHANRVLRLGSRALGAVAALFAIVAAISGYRFLAAEVATFADDNGASAAWVASHVPRDAVVLVHDAGKISLVGEQPLVDLVGLKSAFSIEVHRATTFKACHRVPMAISEIARHAGASYLVVTEDWDRLFRLTESLRFTGWTVERADVERGSSTYRVYRITDGAPPG